MKRVSFCDIVNVNKEKQRRNDTTLRYPALYHLVKGFKCPFLSALHSIVQKI